MDVLASKQPAEAYFIELDFAEKVGEDDAIDTIVATALDAGTLEDVTAEFLDAGQQTEAASVVSLWVRGGESGHNYAITCVVTTTGGATYELDVIQPVLEEPEEPATEPISLTEAKLHLRLAVTEAGAEAYTSEDDLIEPMIQTAREQVEAYTWRKLITQSVSHYLEAWPAGSFVRLPYPPLQSVTAVYYYEYGQSSPAEFTDFWVDTASEPGRLVLNDGCEWPTATLRNVMPIRIDYVAGYGVAADVPAVFRSAMKLILSDLYEHRGEVVVGVSAGRIPDAARNLLDAGGRVWRFD